MQAVKHARKGDGFADVFQAADPGHAALDSHPETAVRDGAVFPQIDVPLEGFPRQVVLLDALAADDFSVAFAAARDRCAPRERQALAHGASRGNRLELCPFGIAFNLWTGYNCRR